MEDEKLIKKLTYLIKIWKDVRDYSGNTVWEICARDLESILKEYTKKGTK